MPNRAYQRAAKQENTLKKLLENKGWLVMRAPGSRGPFDLIAIKHGRALAISCKTDRHDITPLEWRTLYLIARAHRIAPVIADKTGPRHTMRYWLILAEKPDHAGVDDYLTEITLDILISNGHREHHSAGLRAPTPDST